MGGACGRAARPVSSETPRPHPQADSETGWKARSAGRSLPPSAAFTGELLCSVCSQCSWKRRESFAHSSIVLPHAFPVRLPLVARQPATTGPGSLQRQSVRVSECLPLWGSAHVALCSLSPNKPPGKGRGPLLVTWVIRALLEHFLKETDPGKWPEGELVLGKCSDEARIIPQMCACVLSRLSGVSDSLPPHGLQPTRLLCPQDLPGKNTEVGCHFLLQGSS